MSNEAPQSGSIDNAPPDHTQFQVVALGIDWCLRNTTSPDLHLVRYMLEMAQADLAEKIHGVGEGELERADHIDRDWFRRT